MGQGDWALQPGRGGLRVARAVSTAAPSGGTATLTFTGDIPGIFEVELESLKRRLTQPQVQ